MDQVLAPFLSPDLTLLQVEFANVIILNKMDLVDNETANQIEGVIKSLNPSAKIYRTIRSEISLSKILDTKLFDFDEVPLILGSFL